MPEVIRRVEAGTKSPCPHLASITPFALEISGKALKPAYRDGAVIVESPQTPIRCGDRVVVKTAAGEVLIRKPRRRSANAIELASLDGDGSDQALASDEVK